MIKFRRKDGRQKCECGCGRLAKKGNKFINHHNRRGAKCPYMIGDKNPMKRPEVVAKISGKNNHFYGIAWEDHPTYGKQLSGKNHPYFGKKRSKKFCQEQSKRISALGDRHPSKTLKHSIISSKRWKENNPSKNPINAAKISKRMKENNPMKGAKGEKHPNWKGGMSYKDYCPIFFDQEYKQSIRDRDNNECQNPFCWGNYNPNHKLIVHHIDGNKKNCHPSNLIAICRSCNTRAEGNKIFPREFWQGLYQLIMNIKYGYKYG